MAKYESDHIRAGQYIRTDISGNMLDFDGNNNLQYYYVYKDSSNAANNRNWSCVYANGYYIARENDLSYYAIVPSYILHVGNDEITLSPSIQNGEIEFVNGDYVLSVSSNDSFILQKNGISSLSLGLNYNGENNLVSVNTVAGVKYWIEPGTYTLYKGFAEKPELNENLFGHTYIYLTPTKDFTYRFISEPVGSITYTFASIFA